MRWIIIGALAFFIASVSGGYALFHPEDRVPFYGSNHKANVPVVITPPGTETATAQAAYASTPSPEPTQTPTKEASSPVSTQKIEPTSTPSPEPTSTPTPEPTSTPTATSTPTPEPTSTPTPEPTATPEPSPTPSPEPTNTPLPTPTPEPTSTPTPSPTPSSAELNIMVVDAASGDPIEGAVVTVAFKSVGEQGGWDLPKTSNGDGKVAFNTLPLGRQDGMISAYMDGCDSLASYSISTSEYGEVKITNNNGKQLKSGKLKVNCGKTEAPASGDGSYVLATGCEANDPSCARMSARTSVPGVVQVLSCDETTFTASEGVLQAYRNGYMVAYAPLDREATIAGYVCQVEMVNGEKAEIGVAYLCANPFILKGSLPVKEHDKPIPPPECRGNDCAPNPTPTPPIHNCENDGTGCPQVTPTPDIPNCEEDGYNCPTPQPTPTCQELGTCPTPDTTCEGHICITPPSGGDQQDPPTHDPDPVVVGDDDNPQPVQEAPSPTPIPAPTQLPVLPTPADNGL